MPNLRPPVDLRVSNLRFRVLLLTYAEVWPLHESVKHICATDHLLRSLRVDGWLRTSAKQRDGSDRLPGSIASPVYRLHSLIRKRVSGDPPKFGTGSHSLHYSQI